MIGTAIQMQISDHNPMIKDGIILWNLWAPGARNGFQDPSVERKAMEEVSSLQYPNNIADIVRKRLDAQIDLIIRELKNAGKDKIDAICLQEVADGRDKQIKKYFLENLNHQLAINGFKEFTFKLNKNGDPVTKNNVSMMCHTGTESFANLTLINSNKYELVSSRPRNDIIKNGAQDNRVFESKLKSKNPSMYADRTLWNGHVKWDGTNHHPHVQEFIKQAAIEGATFAADTNSPVYNLYTNMNIANIEMNATLFANSSNPDSANKVLGRKGEFVDAIITPVTAPHLNMNVQPKSKPQDEEIPQHTGRKKGKHGLNQIEFSSLEDAESFSKAIFKEYNIANQYGTGHKQPKDAKGRYFVRLTDEELKKVEPLIKRNQVEDKSLASKMKKR